MARPRFNLVLIGSFAVLALALAAVGVHGVVAYLVTQRTRELGVRLALGAVPAAIVSMVVRQGLKPVALGGVTGTAAAAAGSRLLQSQLFGVEPVDTASFAIAAVALLTVAATAAYLAARRVSSVDPITALRAE